MTTSIGRSLDRRYPTNRAVLRLLPVAVVVAGAVALASGESGLRVLGSSVAGLLSAFGGWALTRELAPDDNAAAFVSMALGFAVHAAVGPVSLLVLFTTMFLARIVNRTVGPRAKVTDSIVVASLAVAVVYIGQMPLFGIVAALTFALDAVLHDQSRRQWLFAGLCLVAAATWFASNGIAPVESTDLASVTIVFMAVVALLYAGATALTRELESTADLTGARLSVSRVRAGMLIALLVASQAVLMGQQGFARTALVWTSLAGVAGTTLVVSIR